MTGALANFDLGALARALTLRAGHNTQVVMAGAAMLGLAAGVVGAFAMLRGRALLADVVSHSTLPGVGAAFMVGVAMGGEGRSFVPLLVGACATGLLGALAVQGITRVSRVRDDAAMALVLSVFFGAGTVLLSVIQGLGTGREGGLKTFIYGQTATMLEGDARRLGAIALLACAVVVVLFKEFRLLCFDRALARAQGWPVAMLDGALIGLVVVVLAAGLPAVGVLLVVALLVIPAGAARFWSDRLSVIVPLAGGAGMAGAYAGAGVSSLAPGLPAGAMIVLCLGGVFVLSALGAPARGLGAVWWRGTRARRRIALDHFLRAWSEGAGGSAGPVAAAAIGGACGWSGARTMLVLAWARLRGLARTRAGAVDLTARGRSEAARVMRNHLLWEAYLVRYAEMAPSHVHFAADLIEHVLGAEVVRELERSLEAEEPAGAPAEGAGEADAARHGAGGTA